MSFLFLFGILICNVLYGVLFNGMAFLEAVKVTMSTLGAFMLIMIVFGLLIIFPLVLIQIKIGNKKFLDSIGYKNRK